MLANYYCNDLQFFFWIENCFSHYRSQLCDLYLLARVTELAPIHVRKWVHLSSFLEPVGHSLRISADLNRRHKPVAEPFLLCLTLFPSFVKTKAFSEEQEARQLIKFKAKFFSHLLWSSGHRRLKFFPSNF